MAHTWREGKQQITFPSGWQCIKLDEHRYYKRISGMGIKCVDYLALDPHWGLYLIELKDYPALANIPKEQEHVDMLISKKIGSIKLIQTVNAALRRQWYYRIIFLKLKLYKLCPSEWKIWHLAEQYIEAERITIIGDLSHEINRSIA